MKPRFSFAAAGNYILTTSCKLTPSQRLVYLALAKYADGAGVCFPSVDTLAASTGFERKTVMRAIAGLEAAGVITRRLRGADGDGKFPRAEYTVRAPAVASPTTVPAPGPSEVPGTDTTMGPVPSPTTVSGAKSHHGTGTGPMPGPFESSRPVPLSPPTGPTMGLYPSIDPSIGSNQEDPAREARSPSSGPEEPHQEGVGDRETKPANADVPPPPPAVARTLFELLNPEPPETPKPSPVETVFAAFVEGWRAAGRKGTPPTLDDKRRKKIAARLREHPLEVVSHAARGIWFSGWHVANNQVSPEIAFRDAGQIERFAPLGQGGVLVREAPRPGARIKQEAPASGPTWKVRMYEGDDESSTGSDR